jgi:5-methylcytosine-specific restriction enzyme A
MSYDQNYIYKKEIDWSLLNDGFNIPVSIQILFYENIKNKLRKGDKRDIKIIIENNFYKARLTNINFDSEKYPNHKELLQVRYSRNSDIAKILRNIFSQSYNYLNLKKEEQLNKRSPLKTPENIKEYIALYATDEEDIFYIDCITSEDISDSKKILSRFNEDELLYEINYKRFDETATLIQKQKLTKIRKLDLSISKNLKILYKNKCQICGNDFGHQYNANIIEGHHIEFFTSSLNNNSENIMIICPNHHRIVHKTKPDFDKINLLFLYPNGLKEKIKLNLHL